MGAVFTGFWDCDPWCQAPGDTLGGVASIAAYRAWDRKQLLGKAEYSLS